MANRKLTEKTKVRIWNNTSGSLSFRDNEDIKYFLPLLNSYKDLEIRVLQGVYSNTPQYFEKGYVLVEKDVYEFLGIDEEVYSKILSKSQIEELLQRDAEEISKVLDEVPVQIKENVASVAREKKIDSKKKTKVIKEKTGFTVDEEEDEE